MPTLGIDKEKAVFNLLVSKYQADPAWFRRNLPDVTPFMEDAVSPPRPSRPPFKLSDNARASHIEALSNIRGADGLGPADAVRALERCAALLRERSLPREMDHDALGALFKAAFGKSPNSYRKNSTFAVREDGDTESVHRVSLVRGVALNLNSEMRLVSVSVNPVKVREWKELMKIAGIGRDPKRDVSVRHDDYLAEISPHGN